MAAGVTTTRRSIKTADHLNPSAVARAPSMPVRSGLIAMLLFGSGFCALLYGTTWLREFRLVFGASTAASAAVIGVFWDVGQMGPEVELCLWDFGVRLETIGYMVFRRILKLDMVDDLIGGVTLVFWSRAKTWVERIRIQTDTPKYFEWCEWLVERITERRAKLGHEPAHVRHAAWRE